MNDSIYDTESHEYRFGNHFKQISIPFKSRSFKNRDEMVKCLSCLKGDK